VSGKGGKELGWQGVVRQDEGEKSQLQAAFSAYVLGTNFSFSSSSFSSLLFFLSWGNHPASHFFCEEGIPSLVGFVPLWQDT